MEREDLNGWRKFGKFLVWVGRGERKIKLERERRESDVGKMEGLLEASLLVLGREERKRMSQQSTLAFSTCT